MVNWPKCTECGEPVDPSPTAGHYRYVHGWEKRRSKGANQIAMKTVTDLWCCRSCMTIMQSGLAPQRSLFDK